MSDELKWRVMCGRCEASTDWYSSRDAAIAAWNARADDASKRTCENVNGTYPRCPYCSSVNVLDENYEPQIIVTGEKHKSADKPDSREQLEDDALDLASRIWHRGCYYGEGNCDIKSAAWDENDVIAMLNRQAAITEREVLCQPDERDEQIAELTAERDEWKAKAESALHENPYVGLVRGKQWERTEISDYYCGICGWKVTDHDSYCPECGGALHKASNKPDGKFDARKTAEMPETDATKEHIRDFDDTREQLESDVHQYANPSGYKNTLGASWEKKMLSFLDRQAAITRRETRQSWQDAPNVLDRTNLQTIAELTAECDELRVECDRLREKLRWSGNMNNNLRERIAELEAELAAERATVAQPQERACRIVAHATDGLMSESPRRLFKLSCGHSVMLAGLTDEPAFCAICGAVVVKPAGKQDTREEIEADIDCYRDEESPDCLRVPIYRVHSWLNRQAAITERECMTAAGLAATETPALQAKVDSLTAESKRWADAANRQRLVAMEQADKVQEITAERDELQAAIDAMGNGQFYAMYRAKCDECDALRERLEAITAALHDKPGT